MGEFPEEYIAIEERVQWATRGFDDEDVVQMQATALDLKTFAQRWKGRTGKSEWEAMLDDMTALLSSLEKYLTSLFHGELAEVLEKREKWLRWELMAKADVPYLGIMHQAPAQLQPELRRIFREHNGYEFDAERYYRESQSEVEASEAEYLGTA